MELLKVILSICITIILLVDLSQEKLLRPKKKQQHSLDPNYCGKILSHRRANGRSKYGYRSLFKTWKIKAKDFDAERSYFHLSCTLFSVGTAKKGKCSNHRLSVRYGKKKPTKLCGKMKVEKSFKETKGRIQLRFGKRRKTSNRIGFKCTICHKQKAIPPPEKKLIFVFSGSGQDTIEVLDPEAGGTYAGCTIPATGHSAGSKWSNLFFHDNKVHACGASEASDEQYCWTLDQATWTNDNDAITGGFKSSTSVFFEDTAQLWIIGGETSGTSSSATLLVDGNDVTSSSAGTTLTTATYGACAVAINDQTEVFIIAGDQDGTRLDKTYIYRRSDSNIDEKDTLGTARSFHACGLYQNRYVIVAGGSTDGTVSGSHDSTEKYDLEDSSDDWTVASATLKDPCWNARIVEIEGELYHIGGASTMNAALPTIQQYNGVNDAWDELGYTLTSGRSLHSVIAVPKSYFEDSANCGS